MAKITRHGGASNMYEIESAMSVEESLATFDKSLGEAEVKEDESSVGDSLSKSSRPTPTIEEILGIARP